MIYNLLFLLLFMASGSILVVFNLTDFIYILLVIIPLSGIAVRGRFVIVRESMVRQIIMLSLFVGLAFVRGDSPATSYNLGVALKLLIITFLSMYLLAQDDESLLERLCSLFEIIALISLITFIGSNLFPFFMFKVGQLNVLGDVTSFFGLGYARSVDIVNNGFMRNQGFFWEPGVLGFFTTFVYMLKTYRLRNKRRLWIYYATVLSTVSLGAIGIFLLFYLHNRYKSLIGGQRLQARNTIKFAAISIILFIVGAIFFMPQATIGFLSIVFHRDLMYDSSTMTRWIDFHYGLRAALERPLIGWGRDFSSFYDLTLLELNKSKESYDGGISNSVIAMWYMYGGIFLCYYLYLVYRFSKWVDKDNSWFILLLILLLLMHEPLAFSIFIVFFITAFGTEKPHRVVVVLRKNARKGGWVIPPFLRGVKSRASKPLFFVNLLSCFAV